MLFCVEGSAGNMFTGGIRAKTERELKLLSEQHLETNPMTHSP